MSQIKVEDAGLISGDDTTCGFCFVELPRGKRLSDGYPEVPQPTACAIRWVSGDLVFVEGVGQQERPS